MYKPFIYTLLSVLLAACTMSTIRVDAELDQYPLISPGYIDCTIPPNIAPLNFRLTNDYEEAQASFTCGKEILRVKAGKKQFTLSPAQWARLLQAAPGKSIEVKIVTKHNGKWTGYAPFLIHVAKEPIDPYIAYRLIEPGYELWKQMGIYQRHLETYTQSVIVENKMSGYNCMNCHSFCMQNPEKMLFHMRGPNAGTLLVEGDVIEKLNTKTGQTISALVYPSWHPSGRYIAFSVNDTKQSYHLNDKNRIEVYDNKSDIVVYDVGKHEIFTTPALFSDKAFETFPTSGQPHQFSPLFVTFAEWNKISHTIFKKSPILV